MNTHSILSSVIFFLIAISAVSGHAVTVTLLEPKGDRWMYWFGDFDGARSSASVYGAYGSYDYVAEGYDFDDRHAQMFLDFDTTSIAPVGRGASNYQVTAIEIRLVVNEENQFRYDPTHDTLSTYTGEQQDTNLGRPMELLASVTAPVSRAKHSAKTHPTQIVLSMCKTMSQSLKGGATLTPWILWMASRATSATTSRTALK